MSFGERIHELRKSKSLTQKQFADELNLSTTTVASWEKEVKKPSFEVLILISEKFNVSLDWICETKKQNDFKGEMTRTEALNKIYDIVKEVYGESVSVHIDVSAGGIECKVDERPFTVGYSMRTINGYWIEEREPED